MLTPHEWLDVYINSLQSDNPLTITELVRRVQDDAVESVAGKALLTQWINTIKNAFRSKDNGDT